MIPDTISSSSARRFYDRLGAAYDAFTPFECRAKARGLALLDAQPGERALNVGAGTGREHARLRHAVAPDGIAVAVDLSPVILRLTRRRTGAPALQADACHLPLASGAFDGLWCSFVLDLIPLADLPGVLAGFRRVLRPGGRLGLVSLPEGITAASRVVVGAWKRLYAFGPTALWGCRPLLLGDMVEAAGFRVTCREVVVQFGVPSEVVIARAAQSHRRPSPQRGLLRLAAPSGSISPFGPATRSRAGGTLPADRPPPWTSPRPRRGTPGATRPSAPNSFGRPRAPNSEMLPPSQTA